MPEASRPRWKYEPDEYPKKKHGWHKDEAGFIEVDGVPVGKCPKGMTLDEAEELLNEGVPHIDEDETEVPKAIYAVRGGVVYRAVPTRHGISYHGFPMLPSSFERLPRRIRERVIESARRRGMEKALREWLAQ